MSLNSSAPFWGEIDAMHQFCEVKYEVTPFFAEFWNAVSNIPTFILPGLYGLWQSRSFGIRITLEWATFVLVGLGSLMFHATMRFKWEMLDEVPMFAFVVCAIVAKEDTHWLMSGRWKLAVRAVAIGIATMGMYLYLGRGEYAMFVHAFTGIVLLDTALAFTCAGRPDENGSLVAWGCLEVFAVTLTLGRVAWEIENNFCPPGHGGVLALLHVLWHGLAGFACYFGMIADCQIRHVALGIGAAVDEPRRCWPLLWMVRRRLRRMSHDGESDSLSGLKQD